MKPLNCALKASLKATVMKKVYRVLITSRSNACPISLNLRIQQACTLLASLVAGSNAKVASYPT